MSTPEQLGYHFPPEWEPHAATWLTWPRSDSPYFRDRYDSTLVCYARLVRELVTGEEVHINVGDPGLQASAERVLREHGVPLAAVFFHQFPVAEPWLRDYGPVFLARNPNGIWERAIVGWRFNAWGGKSMACETEDALPSLVAQFLDVPFYPAGMILEGSAIETNGAGSLLVTESCLLNNNRNPELNRLQVQNRLKEFLGVSNILWLGDGLAGDETDGHVDALARFVNSTTIMATSDDDINDANYLVLQDTLQLLRTMRDQNGKLFRIVKIPTPGLVEYGGQRLGASYLHFYMANTVVLVPQFRRRADSSALEIFRREFPDHKVVGVDVTGLMSGMGSIHAALLHEPA